MRLDKLLYPKHEAAAILGVSKHTIARDCRLGRIKTRPYGRLRLIPRDEILRIAAEGLRSAAGTHTGRIA